MATRKVATVFGGSGFIGRYVVKRLAARGYVVRAAVRDTEAALFLKPMGAVGQVVLLHAALPDHNAIAYAVQGAELVVNLAGILNERRPGDFEAVHAVGAGLVAEAAASSRVSRLVHVSAIGADAASPSLYAKSKAAGEKAVRAAFPAASILRPSIVFGPEDEFFNRFATMARYSPVMPVISGATRLQPVYVGDVADAVMAALTRADSAGQTYALGGPKIWSFRELLAYILKETRRDRWLMTVPAPLARLQAAALERLPGKLLTRDQLLLLAHDNVAPPDLPGLAALNIVPTPLELVVPAYLQRYRSSSGKRDIYALG
jgi:uncharacterized protein YbjT (DUF2867 family)